MLPPNLPLVEPTETPAADLAFPEPLDLFFEGFTPEAFAILERLRERPHIEQYREEKEGIQRYIQAPFKRYRDDLVVNWVLPNRLDFETEKNVFARILKNDFGAGGSHHHLWMSFYRPGRRRLTDVQISHGISPDGFTVGLFAGEYAKDVFREAKGRIEAEPERFSRPRQHTAGRGGRGDSPPTAVPERVARRTSTTSLWQPYQSVWTRQRRCGSARCSRAKGVLAWEGTLVQHALEKVRALWPLYRFIAAPGQAGRPV